MKSAVKILEEKIGIDFYKKINAGMIIECMEEYADQFKQVANIPKTEADRIEQGVCDYFGVSIDEVKSPDTSRSVTEARSIIFYLLRDNTRLTLAAIGGRYNRNHSTVLNSNKKVLTDWLENDKIFIRSYAEIVALLFNSKSKKEKA